MSLFVKNDVQAAGFHTKTLIISLVAHVSVRSCISNDTEPLLDSETAVSN